MLKFKIINHSYLLFYSIFYPYSVSILTPLHWCAPAVRRSSLASAKVCSWILPFKSKSISIYIYIFEWATARSATASAVFVYVAWNIILKLLLISKKNNVKLPRNTRKRICKTGTDLIITSGNLKRISCVKNSPVTLYN